MSKYVSNDVVFGKNFDKNLLDYTAACWLAYTAPSLTGAGCGKISLAWCGGGEVERHNNSLAKLFTVITDCVHYTVYTTQTICQHLVSPCLLSPPSNTQYLHTTFLHFHTIWKHSLHSPQKQRVVCYSCLMYRPDKYYWGCWPERIKYSHTIRFYLPSALL